MTILFRIFRAIFLRKRVRLFRSPRRLKLRKTLNRYNTEDSDFRSMGERSLEARMFPL